MKKFAKGRLHVPALAMNDVTLPVLRRFVGYTMYCDSFDATTPPYGVFQVGVANQHCITK